jgi:GNAT superfamily N-acetyltransferase
MGIEKLTIRQYRPTDREKIIELLDIAFKKWPHFDLDCSPKDHWDWKFIDNPLRKKTIVLAEIDNKIVSCDHMLYNQVKIGNIVRPCGQSVDMAVHPDFRGRGIYSKMRKFETETEIFRELGYWASSNPIVLSVENKMGNQTFPHPVSRLVRIRDIDLHLKDHSLADRTVLKLGYETLRAFSAVGKTLYRSPRINSNIDIDETSIFGEGVDDLWEKMRGSYLFATERRREYLNWRYCDHRAGRFRILTAKEKGELIGYAALRVNTYDKDYPIGYLADLCALPARLDCADALIFNSLKFFDDLNVNLVDYCGVRGHPYEKRVRDFGFVDSRNNVFVGYSGEYDERQLQNFKSSTPEQLLFQWGDLDWI